MKYLVEGSQAAWAPHSWLLGKKGSFSEPTQPREAAATEEMSSVATEVMSSAATEDIASKLVFWGKRVSSRLGLRTEISARYYRETTRTDVPHLFVFMRTPYMYRISLFFCDISTLFSVKTFTPL